MLNPLNAAAIVRPGTPRTLTDNPANSARFRASFAVSQREVLASQRLRYQVFGKEMGAKLSGRFFHLDRDRYDSFCRHLLVRDTGSGKIIACTRILTQEHAERAGQFYSAGEFDINPVLDLPGRIMELGRTCVHPSYRNGAVVAVLWSRIAEFILDNGYDYLIGSASIDARDGGANTLAIMQRLEQKHMTPPWLRVQPRYRLPAVTGVEAPEQVRIPPLIKAYLSLGARAAGEPCWDEDFGVADVFMLLNVNDMSPRYARRFLKRDAANTNSLVAH